MMKESVRLSPSNSLILLMDHAAGELPDHITEELIAATETCLAIGTLSAADGETRITMTDSLDCVGTNDLVFDGSLHTPNRELSVCDVNNEKLITFAVPKVCTPVKVFVNDFTEPDDIAIFVDCRA